MWRDSVNGCLEKDLRVSINPHLGRRLMLDLGRGGWRGGVSASCCTQGQGNDPRHLVCIVLCGHCL